MANTFISRPSRLPGSCASCRHLNHGTDDHEGGLNACHLSGGKAREAACDVALEIEGFGTLYLYEPYDGENGTWGIDDDGFDLSVDHLK